MNGRVYDPALGRFLSADPLLGNLGDSQSINPYAYVGNRPLNATDSTGYVVDGGASVVAIKFIFNSLAASILSGVFPHGGLPPPPATSLPGQSAQNGIGLCNTGTFAFVCTGTVLYAGAPALGHGGLATSSWTEASAEDDYAQENFELLLRDLGINAIDVLILSTVHDAKDAYDAARSGEASDRHHLRRFHASATSSSRVSQFLRRPRRCGERRNRCKNRVGSHMHRSGAGISRACSEQARRLGWLSDAAARGINCVRECQRPGLDARLSANRPLKTRG